MTASPQARHDIDLMIVGGGVAGLWTLNRAVKAGYDAILVEKDALGAGQTIHAQGIIHGGTKYTLSGKVTEAANAIAAMPARWRACLAGSGDVDLSGVRLLSDATYMWSRATLGARMTALFASHALRSRVGRISKSDVAAFDHAGFDGSLYRLDEFVLDLPSLLERLAAPVADRIFRADAARVSWTQAGDTLEVALTESSLSLRARRVVIAAGEGVPTISQAIGVGVTPMQRRPLHMVVIRHRSDLPVFGHGIGASATPLVTVTTHPAADGRQVWYMGGGLAEDGVERCEAQQVDAARECLRRTLPWLEPANAEWATFRIDRAEPAQTGAARPDAAFAEARGPVIVGWPTKLALAPDLADRVMALLPPPSGTVADLSALAALGRPAITRPVWERLFA